MKTHRKNDFTLLKTAITLCITLLLHSTCLAQGLAENVGQDSTVQNLRVVYDKIIHVVSEKSQINTTDLGQLKILLKTFASVLGKKLHNSDQETKKFFAPVLQLVKRVLSSPEAAPAPDTKLYQAIEKVLAEIPNNPVMAIAWEESLRHFGQTTLATIRPDRGHGSTYRLNEHIQLRITASQDCFVQIFFLSSQRGKHTDSILHQLMFQPEPGKKYVFLASGDSLFLGEDGSFSVEPPYGNELIFVVASQEILETRSNVYKLNISYPIDFAELLTKIYGENKIDKLSLHSTFLESKPPPGNSLRKITETH